MAINLCEAVFKPRIHCNTVSLDDYCITNLISSDLMTRRKGFMAERFIKPPISITVEFPFNIDIHSIVIDPSVGTHKSCGFQIFTQSAQKRPCWLKSYTDSKTRINKEKAPATIDGTFLPIVTTVNMQIDKFCFLNDRYRPCRMFSNLRLPEHSEDACKLSHRMLCMLSSASHVMVKVIKTLNGSIPSIRRLEIWGQPAASTNHTITEMVLKLAEDIYNKKPIGYYSKQETIETTDSNVDDKAVVNGTLNIDDVNVPSDYIDPITCEVMALPVLLPSGHTVDQSTLERHNSAEAVWGRQPSNPFTGVFFQAGNEPIVNVALKARIDDFLLKNQIDVTTVARTVGRRPITPNIKHYNLGLQSTRQGNVNTAYSYEQTTSIASTGDNKDSKITSSNNHCNPQRSTNTLKRKEQEILPTCASSSKRLKLSSNSTATNVDVSASKSDHHTLKGGHTTIQTADPHEKNLNQTLNTSLMSALSGLPVFSKKQTTTENTHSTGQCQYCFMFPPLYSLPCMHKLCRNCLLKQPNVIQCKECGQKSTRGDVYRVHE